MIQELNKIFNDFQQKNQLENILQGNFGIEKENIRTDENGYISLKPHPKELGDKNTHPYITTDFGESQIEMITPPLSSIEETHGFLETVHDIVTESIGNELLWPQSLPPLLPDENKISVAQFGEKGKNKEEYREQLAKIYGKERQLISGLHYNFSFSENLIQEAIEKLNYTGSIDDFKEIAYLRVVRNFIRYRWFIVYLFGSSPIADPTFKLKSLFTGEKQSMKCIDGRSIRTSPSGYRNKVEFYTNFCCIHQYKNELNEHIKAGKLIDEKELYFPIRIKFKENSTAISHLEVRLLDIDPFEKAGISKDVMYFMHLFLLYCLFKKEPGVLSSKEQKIATQNQDAISCDGINENVIIKTLKDERITAKDWALQITDEMKHLFKQLNVLNNSFYNSSLKNVEDIIHGQKDYNANKIIKSVKNSNYINFHLDLANKYRQMSLDKAYQFHGFTDLELSTQLLLKDSVRRGLIIDILDRKENIIRLSNENNIQYIKQATCTSIDSYSSVLMMENKVVTKEILAENNISVPSGRQYHDVLQAENDFIYWNNNAIVIKPKSTNFGLGITILKKNNDNSLYNKALKIAFGYGQDVLIEKFFPGNEYRFFVINDAVPGILQRVPANVSGNGKNTISELIVEKNKNLLRGKGYKTPLEKIAQGEAEKIFLETQKLNFNSIPKQGEKIFLRENSNISTGGDSHDFTDDVHPSYKDIAVKAAKALGVKITGLDMIIQNIKEPANSDNYTIIELNFNPAIHIHCHPFVGKNRKLNRKILDALGF